MRYKSRFDNPKFMERRARVLARDPSLRSCYPWCTPEHSEEFYKRISGGPVAFTRPVIDPATPTPVAPLPPQEEQHQNAEPATGPSDRRGK